MEQVGPRPSSWSTGPKPGFLELLPLKARPEPRFPSPNDSLSEFGEHLLAGLYNHNTASEVKDLHSALATLNQYALNRAIKDLAEESARELARSLAARLRAKFGDQAIQSEEDLQAKPADYSPVHVPAQDGLTEKVLKDTSVKNSGHGGPLVIPEGVNLDSPNAQTSRSTDLVPPGGPVSANITSNAAPTETEVVSKYGVDPVAAKSVSQLPLYNFIIFADSNGSRDSTSHRILAMKQAAQRVLKVATDVSPNRSAELHFFDDPIVDSKICIASSAQADTVPSRGPTTRGQVVGPLQEKILKPLAKKIENRELENPTIVVIITNGAADIKQASKLANVVAEFKGDFNRLGINPAVFFVFWRVGEDPAEEFLDHLECDKRIQDIFCCRRENLAKRMNPDPNKKGLFTGQLVELLTQALDTESK